MSVIDHLGIEIEFYNVSQSDMYEFINRKGINARVTNDASCTHRIRRYGNINITADEFNVLNDTNYANWGNTIHVGGEVVSGILHSEEAKWFNPINDILKFLEDNGEKPSLTTALHVHLNFGTFGTVPIFALHAMLDIWSRLEATMFRITQGEMGFSRGTENLDHCYCRPIVPFNGPHIIRDSDGYYRPNQELEKLHNAKTTKEFFQSLARSDRNTHHYYVSKYHAINFLPILRQGTVELRTANLTLNPDYVYTWVKIFQKMVALSYGAKVKNPIDYDRPLQPLGYNDNSFTYEDLIETLDLRESRVQKTLQKLWSISSWTPAVNGFMRSHLGRGMGSNMPESRPHFNKIRKDLVPSRVNVKKEKIYNPEDFMKVKNTNAGQTATRHMTVGEEVRNNEDLQGEAIPVDIQQAETRAANTIPEWTTEPTRIRWDEAIEQVGGRITNGQFIEREGE